MRIHVSCEDARLQDGVSRVLSAEGHTVVSAGESDETPSQALLVEFPGTRGDGRTLLQQAAQRVPRPVLLALCPHGMREAGVAALKDGADDFVLLPVDPEELSLRLHAIAARLPDVPRVGAAEARRRLRGSSPALQKVREQVARVATGTATVLITGETGTGKELVAGLIHEASPRFERPMVKVNCAALPDPLLESELFGHERGAFTGAEQRRIGRFEEADGGTLFLDEIGDMHVRTQAKVLRALQEQEFERLGGANTVKVDVRVIAATNQDLRGLIAAGRFREDLFFRLNVVPVELPPLRERVQDVPELVEDFLDELNRGSLRPRIKLTPEARQALLACRWPGNVRELHNVLERAVLMGEGEWIDVADLGLADRVADAAAEIDGTAPAAAHRPRIPMGGISYTEAERALIVEALERVGWVQKEAASLLRMSPRRLNYRIQRLGITHPRWRKNRDGA